MRVVLFNLIALGLDCVLGPPRTPLVTGYAKWSKDQVIIKLATKNGVSNRIMTLIIGIIDVNGKTNSLQQEMLKKVCKEHGDLSS